MFPYSADATGMAGLAILVVVCAVLVIIIGLPLYILGSLGLMKMAQNRGIENPWLAWIPVANAYILGRILKDVDVFHYNIGKLEMVLPLGLVASGILGRIPLIGWLLSIAIFIVTIFVFIKLYKMYAPANYVLYTVLSVIGLFPIFVFIVRNNVPYEVPSVGKSIFQAQQPQQYQQYQQPPQYHQPPQQPQYQAPEQPQEPPKEAASSFCTACGASISATAAFCQNCGTAKK